MQKEEDKLGKRIVGLVANVKVDQKDRKSSDDTNSIESSSDRASQGKASDSDSVKDPVEMLKGKAYDKELLQNGRKNSNLEWQHTWLDPQKYNVKCHEKFNFI